MRQHMVITGGAGFVGTNAVNYFSSRGWDITVIDNLSREGARENLEWLRHKVNFSFVEADIRDAKLMANEMASHKRVDALLHLAAQVAVTTSVTDPRLDFEINALGTLNMLEALRHHHPEALLINASTNKVYGKMDDLTVHIEDGRWSYADHASGIDEKYPLDFHSPYGCSKGAAERYVADYARIYNIPTVSFRQSCIYGTRQFGIEDQGWLAWFVIAAATGQQITIFGDGRQVRDVLFVDDLLAAYERAIELRDKIAGQVFNMGGGPENTLSLLELCTEIEKHMPIAKEILFEEERPGDQKVYVSDITLAKSTLDWQPEIDVANGLEKLIDWVKHYHGR